MYEHRFRVSPDDIDELEHVNNVVYLRYIQDVAIAHWRAAATEELARTVVWVVRRHEIDYIRPARAGEELTAKTWVGEPNGAAWDRFTEIARVRDQEILVRARSVWVALEAGTLRPRRVSEEIQRIFR